MTTDPATTTPGRHQPQPAVGTATTEPGSGHLNSEQDVDVLSLGGQRTPEEGAWLLVTEAGGRPGSEFTAQVLAEGALSAFGGDVLVHLVPATPAAGQPAPAVGVQVYAVLGRRLIPVAGWPAHELDGWPEQIRPAVAFAMGALNELGEHGAELGTAVDLAQGAAEATAGIPMHITFPVTFPADEVTP